MNIRTHCSHQREIRERVPLPQLAFCKPQALSSFLQCERGSWWSLPPKTAERPVGSCGQRSLNQTHVQKKVNSLFPFSLHHFWRLKDSSPSLLQPRLIDSFLVVRLTSWSSCGSHYSCVPDISSRLHPQHNAGWYFLASSTLRGAERLTLAHNMSGSLVCPFLLLVQTLQSSVPVNPQIWGSVYALNPASMMRSYGASPCSDNMK